MELVEIENRLIAELADSLSLDPPQLTNDTALSSVGIDSLSLVRLFVFIESAFNVNLMEAGFSRTDLQDVRSLAMCIRAATGP